MSPVRTNLILACLALVLAAAIFWPKLFPAAPQDPPPLAAINTAGTKRIEIRRHGEIPIVFERQNQQWSMLSPYPARAHTERLQRIIHIPSLTPRVRYARTADNEKKLGLEPPKGQLMLDEWTLEIGDREPLEGGWYLGVDDEIAVVDSELPELILSAPETWLAASLIGPEERVESVELDGVSVPGQDLKKLTLELQSARALWIGPAEMDTSGQEAGRTIHIQIEPDARSLQLLLLGNGKQVRDIGLKVDYHFEKPLFESD